MNMMIYDAVRDEFVKEDNSIIITTARSERILRQLISAISLNLEENQKSIFGKHVSRNQNAY